MAGKVLLEGARALARDLERKRRQRDRSVNNSRTRQPRGSHIPNPRRGRKEILDELT